MMKLVDGNIHVSTVGNTEVLDLTSVVTQCLRVTGFESGLVHLFVPGATGGITTMEYEPGCVKDFQDLLDKVLPEGLDYEHHKRWHDGNGHSHMRSTLVGPSKTFPVIDGRICLEPWMQIVFADFQPGRTKWELALSIVGE